VKIKDCYNDETAARSPVMPIVRFGDFELDDQTFELRRNGERVRLQQQPARVLAFLLNRRGSLVTRDQIREAIWGGDTFVDFEQGLNFCIRQIRLTLNDQPEKPLYIETLPRLGYRFVAAEEPRLEQLPGGNAAPNPNRIRLAIIPVEDLAGADSDYFAAGLTEDMTSSLARIAPDRLRIVAGPKLSGAVLSSGQLETLRRQLNLDFLLRGSVRRSGDKIRIIAQLHDLRDKSVLWSETYNKQSTDLLAAQEEVTDRVSRSLALELLPGAAVGSRRYSQSSAAYDAYLKGRFLWHKMTPEAIHGSLHYFNEALSIDPGFAPAHAGLADCYAQMGSIRVAMMKPIEALAKARPHLERAFELDDSLAEAHCTLGLIKSWYDLDWPGAEREFQTALRLDPSQIAALLWQSLYFLAMGRDEEAVRSVRRAKESEPLSLGANLYLGATLMISDQFDLALRQLQQTVELEPGYYRTYMFLGRTFALVGRHEEAVAAYDAALARNPESIETFAYLGASLAAKGDRKRALEIANKVRAAEDRIEPAILLAIIYANLKDEVEMFRLLHLAVQRKSTPLYLMTVNREFRQYHRDPRFRDLLAMTGLPSRLRPT
jgi:TolB-like protein/Tfp pilus assembly protein PilF